MANTGKHLCASRSGPGKAPFSTPRLPLYKSRECRRSSLSVLPISVNLQQAHLAIAASLQQPGNNIKMPPASSSMGHANDAMDGERLSNESILSGEWSSNEDILNEYGYDPASMKRRAEKSMARVRELYDEGKPLFTREMIEDTQRQIDEIKSGEPPSMTTLSVIGMDGKRHENLWATIVHDNEVS